MVENIYFLTPHQLARPRLLTGFLRVCYNNPMKMWFSILTLSMLVTVQALGTVCKTKCSLQEYTATSTQDNNDSHQDCHSQSDESSDQSNSDECGDICNMDELFSDSKVLKFEKTLKDSGNIPALVNTVKFIDRVHIYNVSTHDPPGTGFYSGVAIYIQKSSYLI